MPFLFILLFSFVETSYQREESGQSDRNVDWMEVIKVGGKSHGIPMEYCRFDISHPMKSRKRKENHFATDLSTIECVSDPKVSKVNALQVGQTQVILCGKWDLSVNSVGGIFGSFKSPLFSRKKLQNRYEEYIALMTCIESWGCFFRLHIESLWCQKCPM